MVGGTVADVLEACPECVVGAGAGRVVRAVAGAGRKKAAYREAAVGRCAARSPRSSPEGLAKPARATSRATPTSSGGHALLRELLQPADPSRRRVTPGRRARHRGGDGGGGCRDAAEAKTDGAVTILGLRCSATLCAGATRRSRRRRVRVIAADALAPARGWTRRAAACAVVARRVACRHLWLGTRAPGSAGTSLPSAWRRSRHSQRARRRARVAARVAAADARGGGGGARGARPSARRA